MRATRRDACRIPGTVPATTAGDPLPFDAPAARAFGHVAAGLRRRGRKTRTRVYDAMIAATAIASDLPVFTCNPDELAGIDGLIVVPTPVPASSDP